jgi:hypothetical protein
MWLELAFLLVALGTAVAAQPWRMLASRQAAGERRVYEHPLCTVDAAAGYAGAAALAVGAALTCIAMPLQLQWSGACLVVLMLGWPLAVPVLLAVGAHGRP